jgi:DNA gyrase/topoisomerase IV subunit B
LEEYSAESIVVLRGLEAVRRRPGMYIGGLGDDGMHELLWQVIGHAVDAHLHGGASYVRVAIDGEVISVEDDGDGIPVDRAPHQPETTLLEIAMTTLYAGGWRAAIHDQARSGLHGLGWPVVNALSDRFDVEVWRDGHHHQQNYARGVTLGPPRDLGPTQRTGTRIAFRPDRSIFGPRVWNRSAIARRLREIAATCPALTTILDHDAMRYPDGIADHARYLAADARPIAAPVRITGVRDDVAIDIALLWTSAGCGRTCGFVETQPVRTGTHIRGLADGLLAAFIALDAGRFGGVHAAAFVERIGRGLVAVVHVTLCSPTFRRIGREELANQEVQPAVAALVAAELHRRLLDDGALREQLLARMSPG